MRLTPIQMTAVFMVIETAAMAAAIRARLEQGIPTMQKNRMTCAADISSPTMGEGEVIASMAKEGDKLILSNVHVSGEGSGPGLTKQAARELGAREGVSEVVVQGGARTGGAVPGHTPVSFTVRVK